ncbi:hypothetical protein MAR_008957 [Mya arenaria]|uniref:RAD51 interacting motif domain-containing protein n=1 Tax=Mya arenaria TaxID=6604 RepID=A0ABY7DZN1_MYAAR|nr:hypothetical protein MAR_008957 [Mya arenaria]
MSERKSIRARKAVDYGKFGGGCSDDDDDFADCTPPVPKKAKLSSNKENKMQKPDKQSKVKETKSRKSVQEKVFERELQEALQLSMSQSDGSQSQEESKSGLSGAPLATSSPIAGKPDPVSKTPTPARPAKLQQNWKPPGSAIGTKSPAISKVKSRQVLTSSVINSPVPSGACLKSPSLGGVNIKSPNTGLRIGLSRNMKLKPLHPNLKISN